LQDIETRHSNFLIIVSHGILNRIHKVMHNTVLKEATHRPSSKHKILNTGRKCRVIILICENNTDM